VSHRWQKRQPVSSTMMSRKGAFAAFTNPKHVRVTKANAAIMRVV
jgi:hypothetical protein